MSIHFERYKSLSSTEKSEIHAVIKARKEGTLNVHQCKQIFKKYLGEEPNLVIALIAEIERETFIQQQPPSSSHKIKGQFPSEVSEKEKHIHKTSFGWD